MKKVRPSKRVFEEIYADAFPVKSREANINYPRMGNLTSVP